MQHSIPSSVAEPGQIPEARYAYYRRCQVFRKNGEQCKAPAEKGASICYAHAGQQAMAFRRDLERRIVLAEAAAEMRRQGRPEFEMADLFMDFESIQVTLAVMARALIAGRIDCKTAGRLMVELQTVSKLLRVHCTKTKNLPLIDTDNTELRDRITEKPNLSTEPWRQPFHQERTWVVGDHEDAPESRNNAAKSTGNAASAMNMRTRTAKIVAIRSAKQAQSLFSTFQRQGSRPALLTG